MESEKKINITRTFYFIMISTTWIALGFYGYIGTFNRLLGDSLCSYYQAEKLGLLRSIWFWRRIWSGRYSAYGVDWILTKTFPPEIVPLFIPVIIITWVLMSTYATHLILKSILNGQGSIIPVSTLLGSLVVFITLVTSPYIEQSFFWIDGFRAYTLPVIVLSTYLIIYLLTIRKINLPRRRAAGYSPIPKGIKTKVHNSIAFFISLFLFFASGGLSETFAVFQVVLLVYTVFYYYVVEKPTNFDANFQMLTGGLLGALSAVLVVATAPGNAVRETFFPPHPNIIQLISISYNGFAIFFNGIFSSAAKTMVLFGGAFAALFAGYYSKADITGHGKKIILQFVGLLLLSFSCFPPGVYGYSDLTPERVLSIATFTIAVVLISTAFIGGNYIKQKTKNTEAAIGATALVSIFLLFGSAWINSNNLYQSRDAYIQFADWWDRTDVLIKQAKSAGLDEVIVPVEPNWAGMEELNNNRNHWVNECYSNFYGIQVFGTK